MVIVATIDEPEQVRQIRVLAQIPGDVQWETVVMERTGDFAWSASLPDEVLTGWTVAWFVEWVNLDGDIAPIRGSGTAPRATVIRESPAPGDPAGRSSLVLSTEWVDFASDSLVDHYFVSEAMLRYRVERRNLLFVRTGVGFLDGRGTSLHGYATDASVEHQQAAYGVLELEVGGDLVGLGGGVALGRLANDESSYFGQFVSPRLRLRIGGTDDTNLELGTSWAEDVGYEGWARVAIAALPRVPITADIGVSSLPVGEDVGVRLGGSVGYRFNPRFTLIARFSMNARTIYHVGVSGGAAIRLDW